MKDKISQKNEDISRQIKILSKNDRINLSKINFNDKKTSKWE